MTADETIARMHTINIQTPTTAVDSAMVAFSRPEIKIENLNENDACAVALVAGNAVSVQVPSVELTESFYINSRRKNNIKIQVKLSGSGIYLRRDETATEKQNNTSEQLLRIEDIIGSRFGARLKKRVRGGLSSCQRNVRRSQENDEETNSGGGVVGDSNKKDISAYLYIYAYIRKSEKSCTSRHRTVRILRFRSHERFEENLKSAERWHRGIRVNKNLACGIMASIGDVVESEEPKPLLILLNPKSGSGKSRELFQKHAVPILKDGNVHYELQITTRANYARELICSRKDLVDTYSGIVVASGDGLFYEVLNGLMDRSDWQYVCNKLPLGIIPCGSGNGLAKSIAHSYNEPFEPKPILHATLTCLSGYSAPMDIVRIELAKSGAKPIQMYSFLSVGWGLIADIDIESERLRSIGAQRFTIWTIHRLISLRTYKGKLSYLPWTNDKNTRRGEETPQTAKVSDDDEKKIESIMSSKAIEEDENGFYDALDMTDDDNDDESFFVDAISLDGVRGLRKHVDSWHSATSRRTAYYSIAGQSIRSTRSLTTTPSMLNKCEVVPDIKFKTSKHDVPAPTAPPLNIPLLPDDGWCSEDGEFVMVHAAYTTHLAADCFFAPESRLNDGIIYLVIIRAGCSRAQLLTFMLGMSTGTHIPCTPNEYIQVIPVRAFRIEPFGDDGIMAVDGERVDYGSIQAEILPGMINVMVPSANTN